MNTGTRARALVVSWKDLSRWDLKTARAAAYRLAHPSFRPLGDFVEESTELVRPWEQPDKEWPVYGVTNSEGVFFSHRQKGKDFNAPYKRIKKDWFFHNPTRANVGSLGKVPEVPPDALTSPEYQVWRIRKGLMPEYVEILIHLPFFLGLIDCHRVGGVKERLFTENLREIPVPVVTEDAQRAVVKGWEDAQREIAETRQRANRLEGRLASVVYASLGTPEPESGGPAPKLLVLWWKDLDRWSFNYLARVAQGVFGFRLSKYPVVPLGKGLLDTTNGFCIRPVAEPTPHRMLKLSALTPDGLNVTESKSVTVPSRILERFSIRKGDLLICRSVGSFDHVAKCALVEQDHPDILFPDIMIRAHFNHLILPEYAREVIQTPLGRSYFQSNARTAVGMWKIGAEDIRSFPIPLPTPDVQREIAGQLRERRAEIVRERENVARLAAAVQQEIEEMILRS